MIHDNGNVHDSAGPDWNPFAQDDGDNEDDIGWDDGSGDHAGGSSSPQFHRNGGACPGWP